MTSGARLVIPAVAAWAALALAIGEPDAIRWAAGLLWALSVTALLVTSVFRTARLRRHLLTSVLCAAAAAMVLSCAAAGLGARQPTVVADAAESGALVRASAVLTQTVHEGASRFRATLRSGETGGDGFEGAVPVLVFGTAEAPAAIGSELRLNGTLRAAEAGQSEAFLMFLSSAAEVVRGPPDYLAWAHELRLGLLAAATALPGDGGALLPGLAVGDTSAVGDGLETAMKRSSLSHLTAVSGANCAVVIALIMVLTSAIGIPRGWRVASAVLVLMGFVVLVTPEPSVLRAAVMAVLVLLAIASGRPVRGLPVLALAVLVLLVADPWLARNYGFALSVCASAGLLVLAEPLARWLSRWMPYPLALVMAVPAAAQLACQPVLILLSPALPSYGVLANVLAGPAAPVATVLGLAACILLPLVPVVGHAVSMLAWLPSAWIAAVATFFSSLPGAQLPWPADGWGAALMAVVVVLVVVVLMLRSPAVRPLRIGAVVVLVLASACYLGAVGGGELRRRLSPPQDWVIAACDVGQGDAVLVRNAGEVALIDTGAKPEALGDCLGALGVGWIDVLVLTHFDLDHIGGTDAVVGRVGRALVGPSSGPADDLLVQRLAESGARVDQVAQGVRGELGELRWRVLWPPQRLGSFAPGNDASVVLAFEGAPDCAQGCLSSVFLGDLGEESQNRMLGTSLSGAGSLHRVDVVNASYPKRVQ